METETIFFVLSIVITVGAVVYALYSRGEAITLKNILDTTKQVGPNVRDALSVAEMAVMAAEEYGRTGVLKTSEDKLRFAFDTFRKWVPASRVDSESALEMLHSFVPLANQMGVKIDIQEDFSHEVGNFTVEDSSKLSLPGKGIVLPGSVQ